MLLLALGFIRPSWTLTADEPRRTFGLRRQSEAATALWVARSAGRYSARPLQTIQQLRSALELGRLELQISFNRFNHRGLNRHRPDQPRLQQPRILAPMMPRREGHPPCRARLPVEDPLRPLGQPAAVPFAVARQLLVTNQPIRPEVRHLDHQFVRAWLRRRCHIHPERWLPKHSKVLAIQ